MNRTTGHALQRSTDREQVGSQIRSCWTCECGQQFGPLSVHAARRAWTEHKSASSSEVGASGEGSIGPECDA